MTLLDEKGTAFYVPWITSDDKKAVYDALSSRWLTGGPLVVAFESAFAKYLGVKYAVAVNSCTAALHLSMRALDIGPGDEVIVPDLTFAATANAALFCGAKPVLCDIDEDTYNLSPKVLMEKITTKTKAVIPVHYGGQSCDMKEISEIARDHQLHIVEDCAHSLGAQYAGKMTGTFGEMGCFSFYPTKIITTLEGGMITTNNEKINKRLRQLREHGMNKNAIDREKGATWRYDVVDLGYNYRLTDPQAALGSSQLKRVNLGIKKRISIADYYDTKLESTPGLAIPKRLPNRSHIFHLYTIKLPISENGAIRNKVFNGLASAGVQASVHYTPLHLMTYYKKFLKPTDAFPIAEKIYDQILSLPLYPTLDKAEVDHIAETIKDSL